MATWFQSDASSALRLEEERRSMSTNKCFSLPSVFAMLLKYQPTKDQVFTTSQATNKRSIPAAKSELWYFFSRQRAAAENVYFHWKSGARMPLCSVVFPDLRASLAANDFCPSYLKGPAGCFKTEISAITVRSNCAFRLILAFLNPSNVVKASIYGFQNNAILTFHFSKHRQNHTQLHERQNVLQFDALSENILVCSANRTAFLLALLLIILVNTVSELYSLWIEVPKQRVVTSFEFGM